MDLVPKIQHQKQQEQEEEEKTMILSEQGSLHRSEIKEVDFFSTGGSARRRDNDDGDGGSREHGSLGRDDSKVNVSHPSRFTLRSINKS
jgi:hypothetical protein